MLSIERNGREHRAVPQLFPETSARRPPNGNYSPFVDGSADGWMLQLFHQIFGAHSPSENLAAA
jgi:hypothetical protein